MHVRWPFETENPPHHSSVTDLIDQGDTALARNGTLFNSSRRDDLALISRRRELGFSTPRHALPLLFADAAGNALVARFVSNDQLQIQRR
jgi:hypothetical protein